MLDSNIRDERGILVPTLVLEDRLRDSIEQCMKESRRVCVLLLLSFIQHV